MSKYAGIIVNNESVQVDRIFTYKIPENLEDKIELGLRVKVPFGLGNKYLDGFVLELFDDAQDSIKIKFIKEICDSFAVLREQDIEIIKKMRKKYLCTYLECIKVFIPSGITKGMKEKVKETLWAKEVPSGRYNAKTYHDIFDTVSKNNGVYIKNDLQTKYGYSISSINSMIKHGFLLQSETVVNRYDTKVYEDYSERILNEEQLIAVEKIMCSSGKRMLIHGITGSGKTEVYMNLVKKFIRLGQQSIILVPEIALTPQMVERFKGRFGSDIAVFHSKLSEGERYDEWKRVKQGRVKVAIGARSAVFLPFENLGLIVIDEEHEQSYKSESDPKYLAREVAEMRQETDGCTIVLGSATPSVDTYYKCEIGEYELLELKHRADGAKLPNIEVSDMREELSNGNKSMFSTKLQEALESCLDKDEQAILFLNRRGFSTFVSCRKCGYVFKCNNCDISLTYHSGSSKLSCHYCGHKQALTSTCPKCGSNYVKYFGVGTEKVEQEIKRSFSKAKPIRMDFDTTRGKESYSNIYSKFKDKSSNVLIGTQMVAKGLDFKDVTLVGVIAADLSLNMPDYRSGERTFQLITQVCGRAGRGEKSGKAIIQTYNPEDYSIRCAIDNDYASFYKHEIEVRREMHYPPFSKVLSINISSEDESLLIKCAQRLGVELKDKLRDNKELQMLGPCPCGISKIKNFYRWQILIKGNLKEEQTEDLKVIIYENLKSESSSIRISLDINPNSLL